MKKIFLQLALLFVSLHSAAAFAASIIPCEALLTQYGDGFSISEEHEAFWEKHPRFGITLIQDKFVLVTRSIELNRQLQGELKSWLEASGEKATSEPVEFAGFPAEGAIAFDVTGILPKFAREYHWRDTTRGNCWGVACLATGLARGVTSMNDAEFTLLLESDLVKRVTSRDQLKPGDLIAIRAASKHRTLESEIHGAVYVSDNLMFSKNGAGEGPLRLQDSNEVLYTYMVHVPKIMGLRIAPVIEVYRVTPLDSYIEAHKTELAPELLEALAQLKTAELLSTDVHISDRDVEAEIDQVRWRANKKQLFQLRSKLYDLSQAKLSGPATEHKPSNFLWKLIRQRTSTLF